MTPLATRRALDRYARQRQRDRRERPYPNLDAARGIILAVILSLPIWIIVISGLLWAFA